MRHFRRKILPALLLAGVGMAPVCPPEAQAQAPKQTPKPAQASQPLQTLLAEVIRLQGVLHKVSEATPEKARGDLADVTQQLDLAKQQTSPSVLLYRLHDAFIEVEQRAFIQAHADAGKDFSRLETVWTAEKARFAAAQRPDPAAPLAAALAQAAENKAQKLYRAALPYGKAAGPGAGIYYLGEAEGNMAFHDFVAGFALPAGGEKVPDAATLKTVLVSLEAELQKDFDADPAGQEMIPASALLKEARELLERDFRAGAALTMLVSRLELSRHRKGGVPPVASPAPAAEKIAEGSLIAPFAALTAGEQDETARIIRADVIPLYQSFSRKSK